MKRKKPGYFAHLIFLCGVIIKGINGIFQTFGGFLLIFFSSENVKEKVEFFTQEQLGDGPPNVVANFLLSVAESLSIDQQIYWGSYILAHGVIKVGLVTCLLLKQLWAYPTSMILFGLIIIYQLYTSFSLLMVGLSIFDLIVIYFTYKEYLRLKIEFKK